MSIAQTKVIDFIRLNKENTKVYLTIADDWNWDLKGTDASMHLQFLQEKLNNYIAFIENGEIFSEYPEAKGKPLEIEIYFKTSPSVNCIKFLDLAKKKIENEVKVGFNWKLHKN